MARGRLQGTKHHRVLAYSGLGLCGETRMGKSSIWNPQGLHRPGLCGGRSLSLDPRCLPLLRLFLQLGLRHSRTVQDTRCQGQQAEAQGVLPLEDNCFPLGMAYKHLLVWASVSLGAWILVLTGLLYAGFSLSSCICKMGIIMSCLGYLLGPLGASHTICSKALPSTGG